jgi:hypothetical protein
VTIYGEGGGSVLLSVKEFTIKVTLRSLAFPCILGWDSFLFKI